MINFIFQVFGSVPLPQALSRFGDVTAGGLGKFLNVIFNTLVVAAGIYTLFNFIIAGYTFLSAGGDPKKIQDAWSRIWQSILGLVFVAGAFALAGIFGWLIFGSFDAILNPQITTP